MRVPGFVMGRLAVVAMLVALLAACGGGGGSSDTPPPPAAPSGTVAGTVVDADTGLPLAGVSVKSGALATTSAADGKFSLPGLAVGDAVLSFELASHTRSTARVAVADGATSRANPRLTPIGVTQVVDAASAAVVSVPGSTAQVSLPAGGLVTASGAAATGNVTVEVTPIDPAANPDNMPGNYTAQLAGGGAPATIESFGAIQVNLRDAAGNALNLGAGQTATIRIPVSTRSADTPATIPLFFFNEVTGLWVQEGSATLAGTAPDQYYEGTVTHFSTWNADRYAETIFVKGCVVDVDGKRVANADVRTYGTSYSGTGYDMTDANGEFSVPMQRGGIASLLASLEPRSAPVISVGPSQVDIVLPECLVLSNAGTAPVISFQPQDMTADTGGFAFFIVDAFGSPPLRFQWQRDGVDIPGATQSILLVSPVVVGDAGSYTVVVRNDFGSATSTPAVLAVNVVPLAPLIRTQPAAAGVTLGDTATFSVLAESRGGDLSYQWQRGGVDIPGATASSYTTPATVAGDNGAVFRVIVSSSNGRFVLSNGATLAVNAVVQLAITQQPQSVSVPIGQIAIFSVQATGNPPLSYQWRRNGVDIAGATSQSYSAPAATLADDGAVFSVVVAGRNQAGIASSNATLTVLPPPALTITQQPQPATVNVGQSALFTVVANGNPPLTYQWRRNGVDIASATASSYATPATVLADSGAVFSVVVTGNGQAAVTSNGAALTVNQGVPAAGRWLLGSAGPSVTISMTFADGESSGFSQALVAVNSDQPGNGAVTIEPVGQTMAGFAGSEFSVFDGTVSGGQLTNYRERLRAYFKGNRLYKLDTLVSGNSVPTPVLLSSLQTSEVCGNFFGAPTNGLVATGTNVSAPLSSWLFLLGPGADGNCGTADDRFRAVRMDMGASTPALTIGTPLAEIVDTNGVLTGMVVLTGNQVQRLDANLANPVNLFTVNTSTLVNYGVSFGGVTPGVWMFTDAGQLWAVNLTNPAVRTSVAVLASGETVSDTIVSDAGGAYVAINRAASARILRISPTLAASSFTNLTAPVGALWATPTRLLIQSIGATTALTSILKDGSGPLTPLLTAASGQSISSTLVSGENAWVMRDTVSPGSPTRPRATC